MTILSEKGYYLVLKLAMALALKDYLTIEERNTLDEYNDALEEYVENNIN